MIYNVTLVLYEKINKTKWELAYLSLQLTGYLVFKFICYKNTFFSILYCIFVADMRRPASVYVYEIETTTSNWVWASLPTRRNIVRSPGRRKHLTQDVAMHFVRARARLFLSSPMRAA